MRTNHEDIKISGQYSYVCSLFPSEAITRRRGREIHRAGPLLSPTTLSPSVGNSSCRSTPYSLCRFTKRWPLQAQQQPRRKNVAAKLRPLLSNYALCGGQKRRGNSCVHTSLCDSASLGMASSITAFQTLSLTSQRHFEPELCIFPSKCTCYYQFTLFNLSVWYTPLTITTTLS